MKQIHDGDAYGGKFLPMSYRERMAYKARKRAITVASRATEIFIILSGVFLTIVAMGAIYEYALTR
jgi:hypothetical protein